MTKKRGLQIKINLTNRWLYALITIGILMVVGVGVYAYGTSNPSIFGHSVNEVGFPTDCQVGEFLKWDGNSWICSNFE